MNRRSSLFWGTILILLAGLLVLQQAGIISDVFGFFWPLAIIALGIWLIVGYITRRQPVEGKQVSIPLEGATNAFIKLEHGAGRVVVGAGGGPDEILNGVFSSGMDYKSRLETGRLEVKLRSGQQFWAWWPGESLDWQVHLNPFIPLAIKFDSGASSSILDLSDLKVTFLDIDTGASTTEVTLPKAAGNTHMEVDTGASTFKINIPEGVAASIRVKSGISSVTVAERFVRQAGGLYQSPDYATAANKVDINLSTGVGTVEIR